MKVLNRLSLLKTKMPLKQDRSQKGILNTKRDIYSGEETIRFDNRHPIYKALMKLEFEDVLRSFSRKQLFINSSIIPKDNFS